MNRQLVFTWQLAICFCLLPAPCFPQSGWQVLPFATPQTLRDVHFIRGRVGTVVGEQTTILRTVNAGQSWSVQTGEPGQSLHAVSFATIDTGVAAGENGTILFTTNGGAQWTTVQTGWLISYYGAHQRTARHGVLAGQNSIFQPLVTWTTNGWQTYDSRAFYIQHDGTNHEGLATDVFALSDSLWVVTAATWNGHGAICRTTDGGNTWRTVYWRDNTPYYGLDFPTAEAGYAAGASCQLARTTDGGATWEPLFCGMRIHLYDVDFVSADTGWIVGENGAIMRTDNGGANWRTQPTGNTSYLRGVSFANADTGFAVGDDGVILRTFTGGEIGGNRPPGPFVRQQPPDSSQQLYFPPFFYLSYSWSTSVDPDGDAVTYLLHLAYSHDTSRIENDIVLQAPLFVDVVSNLYELGSRDAEARWTVKATDGQDTVEAANGEGFYFVRIASGADEKQELFLPSKLGVTCAPNPFNATTEIQFTLPRTANADLRVFDIQGREVARLAAGRLPAGAHKVAFHAGDLPSGIYVAVLSAGAETACRKMVLLK